MNDRLSRYAALFARIDLLILLEVYPAGEREIPGADSRSLAASIRQRGRVDPIYVEQIDGVRDVLEGLLRSGDIVMTQGAGETARLARELAMSWERRRTEAE